MKEESERQQKDDNSVVAETKKLTETYESLVKETEEKKKLMNDQLFEKDGKADDVSSQMEVQIEKQS